MLASRLNVSTLAVDGCEKDNDPHEDVFRTPGIDEISAPPGSSGRMLFDDVPLGNSTMMTTLLVLYIF